METRLDPRPPGAPEAPDEDFGISTWAVEVLLRPRVAAHTPAWHAARREVLTATGVAVVLGFKLPYKKAVDLFHELAGPAEAVADPAANWFVRRAMDHGTQYEPEACQHFSRETGMELVDEADVGLLVHPTHPWLAATPDRLLARYPYVLEAKCPYTGAIQPRCRADYYAQMQTQMAVTGARGGYLVQYRPFAKDPLKDGTRRPRQLDVVHVPFDPEFWEEAVPVLRDFWAAVVAERTHRATGAGGREFEPPPSLVAWNCSLTRARLMRDGHSDAPRQPMKTGKAFGKAPKKK